MNNKFKTNELKAFKARFMDLVENKFEGKHTKLARAANVPPSTLQSWKDTESFNPNGFTVAKIAKACGVTTDWLLTGEGSPESSATEEPKPETLPTTLEDFQRWAVSACEKDPELEQWLSIELKIIRNRAALNTPQIKGGDDE